MGEAEMEIEVEVWEGEKVRAERGEGDRSGRDR